MDISLSDLNAFLKTAELGNISSAALSIGITQPALSLKIKRMEDSLEKMLFKRSRAGVTLTEEGLEFLRYAQARITLDQELFSTLVQKRKTKHLLEGTIRISGHYSILHHYVLPSLSPLLQKHPRLLLHLIVKEDKFVLGTLTSQQVDFAILQNPIQRESIENHFLGREEYVAIESQKHKERKNVFIDSDPSDSMTERFFAAQAGTTPKQYDRCFMHDENGIARAVSMGLGQAILAKKEVGFHKGIQIIKDYKPYYISAYLHYAKQPHYTELQKAVRQELLKCAVKLLAKP